MGNQAALIVEIVTAVIILVLVLAFRNNIGNGILKFISKFVKAEYKENINLFADKMGKSIGWIIFVLVGKIILDGNHLHLRDSVSGLNNFLISLFDSLLIIFIARTLAILVDLILNRLEQQSDKKAENVKSNRPLGLKLNFANTAAAKAEDNKANSRDNANSPLTMNQAAGLKDSTDNHMNASSRAANSANSASPLSSANSASSAAAAGAVNAASSAGTDKLGQNTSTAAGEEKRLVSKTAYSYLAGIIKAIIYIFAAFVVLEQWMINVKSLVAGLGIGGIVFALAAQDTAANLVAGVAIMFDKSFEIGDWIDTNTGSGPVSGTVEQIGIRSSRIRCADGSLETVPNSIMGSSVIVNSSKRPTRLVSTDIPINADASSEKLHEFRNEVNRILADAPGVVDNGAANLYFTKFDKGAYIYSLSYNTSSDYDKYLETINYVNSEVLAVLEKLDLKVAQEISVKTVS